MVFRQLMLTTFTFITKIIGRRAKRIGVTSGQPKILDFLCENDGASQADIARACGLEASTLTQVLDGMEKADFIERKKDPNDRRAYHIFLTTLGKEKAHQTVSLFNNIENELFVGLSENEKNEFKRLLSVVNENAKKAFEVPYYEKDYNK